MTMDLPVLKCGNCEPLKLGVHGGVFGLAVLCGLYNAAAWMIRRERHLAVNTVLYTALSIWEHQHVLHHLAEMQPREAEPLAASAEPPAAEAPPAQSPVAEAA